MKILSITAQKPHSTGSGTYLTELVNAFDRNGIEQTVVAGIYRDDEHHFPTGVKFCPVFYTHRNEVPVEGDITFPICGMSDVMPYESTRYRDMDDKKLDEFESVFIRRIRGVVDEFNPDIIVCHHLFLLTALVRKYFPDRRIYGICHGTCLRQMLSCEKLDRIVRPELKKLTQIFALHSEQAENISEIAGIPEDSITVIGSGYNDALFNTEGRVVRSAVDPVRICYAGKMSQAKGIPELLAALNELVTDDALPPIRVALVGGCQDEAVQVRLDDLPEYIDYLGQIAQEELAEVYKTSDIFVLPSYYEGLNLAVIEAMACGLVPVCADLPGMRDWIDTNVINPNIRYVPMPEMLTIDKPTDEGRACFARDIKEVLKRTVIDVAEGSIDEPSDTSGITWDSVANKIGIFR